MKKYITYSYLLTPLHTGASSQAGNMMGIARETHTELPYIPASSLRGKIRSELEAKYPNEAGTFLGERIKDGQQPTESEVWFADATLLLFPIASFSHQFVWITCPLWLSRWNRWLQDQEFGDQITEWRELLNAPEEKDNNDTEEKDKNKKAISTVTGQSLYLQGALLNASDIKAIKQDNKCWELLKKLPDGNGILDLKNKLVILSDDDCAGLVEIGLQREVRVALKTDSKTVDGGSFRSEESIPSETILFFPWGLKSPKDSEKTKNIHLSLTKILNDRLQFGGLESIGHGWTELTTTELTTTELTTTEEI